MWVTPLPIVLPINTTLYYFYSSLFPNSPHSLLLNGFPAMLSTFPAPFSAEFPFSGDHFPSFGTGFQSWEFDPPVLFPVKEPVSPISGSDTTNPAPVTPETGSERKRKSPDKVSSGSDEPDPDERKQKRMVSNRESARRSRMRKQKHLENLRNQVNRYKETNRELMNRLRLVLVQNHFVNTENECLRSEAVMLRQRLWDTRQVLLVRQLLQQQHLNNSAWSCNNIVTSINDLPNNI